MKTFIKSLALCIALVSWACERIVVDHNCAEQAKAVAAAQNALDAYTQDQLGILAALKAATAAHNAAVAAVQTAQAAYDKNQNPTTFFRLEEAKEKEEQTRQDLEEANGKWEDSIIRRQELVDDLDAAKQALQDCLDGK